MEVSQLRGQWVGTAQGITLTLNLVSFDSGAGADGVKTYFANGYFEVVDRSNAVATSFRKEPPNLQCGQNEATLGRCLKQNELFQVWLADALGDRFYRSYRLRLMSSRSMDGWLHYQQSYFLFSKPDSTRIAMQRVGDATN